MAISMLWRPPLEANVCIFKTMIMQLEGGPKRCIKRQGRSQDISKGGGGGGGGGGSQRLLTRSPSGDCRLYMVYTTAFPRVSAGSVVLSRHLALY